MHKNMMKQLLYGVIVLWISQQILVQGYKSPSQIKLNLVRKQIDMWKINPQSQNNSICMSPKLIKQNKNIGFSSNIQVPINCSESKKLVKIIQSCIFKNLAYNVQVYLGNSNQKTNLYSLNVDLTSPWTWIKSSVCRKCERDGEKCGKETGHCETQEQSKTFNCGSAENKCKPVQRCGEIDLFMEGLSVAGQFAKTSLKFKDLGQNDPGIKQYKILLSDVISGQDFLNSDGSLGLGLEYNEDEDGEYQSITEYEQETELVSSVINNYEKIENKIISIYISKSENSLDQHILIGGFSNKYIHEPQNNPWVFLPLFKYDQRSSKITNYFLWQVDILTITVKNNKIDNGQQVVLDKFKQQAIISLSTTAVILPFKQLNQLLELMNNVYSMECSCDEKYFYYVICKFIKRKPNFSDLLITITLGDESKNIPVYVNPSYLVQDCKKEDDKTYTCILNIQRSYDQVTVLGEAAIANSYILLDIENKQLGIVPSKNKYNEDLFYILKEDIKEAVTEVAVEVEYDIEMIFRIIGILSVMLIFFMIFKNINRISDYIMNFCDDKQKRVILSDNNHTNNQNQQQDLTNFQDLRTTQNNNNNNMSFNTEPETSAYEQVMTQKITQVSDQESLDDL